MSGSRDDVIELAQDQLDVANVAGVGERLSRSGSQWLGNRYTLSFVERNDLHTSSLNFKEH